MITKILNSFWAKPVTVVMAFLMLSLNAMSSGKPVTLEAGTPVILETVETISSETCAIGDIIAFRVRHDVYVDDDIVIKEGTIAKGQLVYMEEAKALGKPGYVEIELKEVPAVDGQMVSLVGGDLKNEGEDRLVLSLVLGIVVCLLFLILKGEEAIVPAGTLVNASTAGSMSIDVR